MSKCARCGDHGYIEVEASGALGHARRMQDRPCRCRAGKRWQAVMGDRLGRARNEAAAAQMRTYARGKGKKEGKDATTRKK